MPKFLTMGSPIIPLALRFIAICVITLTLVACQSPSDRWARGAKAVWDPFVDLFGYPPPPPQNHVPIRSDAFYLPGPDEDIVGQIQIVTTRYEDSLPDLARRYDLGLNEITQANPGVDMWVPGEGVRVVLPTQFILPDAPRKGIVLNVATMRLFYYPKPKAGETPIVITHPVGIGRTDWRTPLGKSRIVAKKANPTWYVPASIRKEHAENGDPLPRVVRPGPDNPLGKYAMRLSIPGYLIHGTNKQYGIGMRVSHGCIRLYPEDIERLFKEVPVGTPVKIISQPYLAGWLNGTLYLQAHEPLEEDKKTLETNVEPLVDVVARKADQAVDMVDWVRVAQLYRDPRGLPVPVFVGSPGVDEVLTDALMIENMPPPAPAVGSNSSPPPERLGHSQDDASELTVYLRNTGEKYPMFAE